MAYGKAKKSTHKVKHEKAHGHTKLGAHKERAKVKVAPKGGEYLGSGGWKN